METGRSLICGIVVIPSVSFKDRPLEVYLVMLNAASHIVGRISRFDREASSSTQAETTSS